MRAIGAYCLASLFLFLFLIMDKDSSCTLPSDTWRAKVTVSSSVVPMAWGLCFSCFQFIPHTLKCLFEMTAEVNKAAAMLMLNTSLFPFSASARFLIPSALHVMIHERFLFCVLAFLLSTAGEYGRSNQGSALQSASYLVVGAQTKIVVTLRERAKKTSMQCSAAIASLFCKPLYE